MDFKEMFNYIDGELYWRIAPSGKIAIGQKVGTLTKTGYIKVSINHKRHPVHKIIWIMLNGEIPEGMTITHLDKNKTNNKIENLMLCKFSETYFGKRIYSNNTSGYKGVYWDEATQKWRAAIGYKGRKFALGYFESKEKAYAAYCKAAEKYFGELARLD